MPDTNVDKLCTSAAEFNSALMNLAGAIDADLSKIVRATVLRLFTKIVQISPVDTGAYRASHQIANHEPKGKEGIQVPPQGKKKGSNKAWATEKAKAKVKGWTWHPGDGSIWIFNNVPYAYRLEEGHSKQAAAGIYNVALSSMAQYLIEEAKKGKYWKGE